MSTALNSVTQELSDTSDELRLSNERLRAILQGLDEGVVSIENNQLILLTSRAGNLLGPAPEGATSLSECGTNYRYLQQAMDEAIETGHDLSKEITFSAPAPCVLQLYAAKLSYAPKARSLWCGM